MYKNFKLTENEKKEILKKYGDYGYKKPIKESFDDGKFKISHVGLPVRMIMITVESSTSDDIDITFRIKVNPYGKHEIISVDNDSEGDVNIEEAKNYMENIINSGKLNIPDFVTFDPETGNIK
jgi:hypothetical protein